MDSFKANLNEIACVDCYSSRLNFEECAKHTGPVIIGEHCLECVHMKKLVQEFQRHKHTFTCQKKNKLVTIKESEGHGKYDNIKRGHKISNYVHCRFNFPQFPMNKTRFILGMSKQLDLEEIRSRKQDLQKIRKYLIRQTYTEDSPIGETAAFSLFKNFSFIQFLHEVGMFELDKKLEHYSEKEKEAAYERYMNALSASIKGTGSVILRRDTKDIMTNNFNRRIMGVHQANHDIQIVVDQVCIDSN